MTSVDIINKINSAKSILDVFAASSGSYDISNWSKIYKSYVKFIHPDICKTSGIEDINAKLNEFKRQIEDGVSYRDEAAKITYWPDKVRMEYSDAKIARISFENWRLLQHHKDAAAINFQKYLPMNMTLTDNIIEYPLFQRSIPLSSLLASDLGQNHVNWIINRLFELIAWFESIHMVHAGINLDSVMIIPESHGIVLNSFYHMQYIGNNIKTISGKYQSFYPHSLFSTKLADVNIDIELTKRLAAVLLGDASGIGTKLIKTHDEDYITFIRKSDAGVKAFDVMDSYKVMLKKNFKSQYYTLYI